MILYYVVIMKLSSTLFTKRLTQSIFPVI